MPLLLLTELLVEERPTLSDSDCADCKADGAAELRRVGGGMPGASLLDAPVDGESVNWTPLSPDTVLDDIDMMSTRGVRCSSDNWADAQAITRTERYG